MADAYHTNPDGTIRPFSESEIEDMGIETRGVEDGSHPSYSLDPKGCSIAARYFVVFDQLDAFIAYMLGAARVYTDSSDHVTRLIPQTFPGKPQFAAMAVRTVGHAFVEDDEGTEDAPHLPVPTYEKVEVEVQFEQCFFKLTPDIADNPDLEYDRYVELLPSTTETTYLSLPGSTMKYVTESGAGTPNGIPIPYGVGVPETKTHLAYKWWRVPRSAWDPAALTLLYKRVHGYEAGGIRSYVGTVNKTALKGHDAGTLLFEGVEEEVVPDPVEGDFCFNLVYKFSKFGPGHNNLLWAGNTAESSDRGYFQARKTGSFEAVGSITDGKCLFDEREFRDLWSLS